ncbi:MAG: hypothetical protein O3A06_02200 [Proteobacteria bacterium]|nr:hypothetical protein [Pseudomonadota bacterium]
MSRRHHNPLGSDRLVHVRIAEASGNSAFVLVVVQTLWDQCMGPLYLALERKLKYPSYRHAARARRHPRRDRAARRARRAPPDPQALQQGV